MPVHTLPFLDPPSLTRLPSAPIALLGRSFTVARIDGVRVVLRKGRNRYCWHPADLRMAELVLRGLDVGAVV